MIPQTPQESLLRLRSATVDYPDLLVDSCRKLGSESAIFLGRLGQEIIVIKQFFTNGAERVQRMKAELDHVATAMRGTPHRINACLMVLPEAGAIVLTHAGDTRLSHVLKSAGSNRPAIMAQAGSWLAAYVGDRRRTDPFRPRRWLNRLDEALAAASDVAALPVVALARRHLRGMGRDLAGTPFTRAATHGDFVSINAHVLNGQIVGVDVQGESWLPLAKDVARFLVWQQMTDPGPPPLHHGISAADLGAMVPQVGLAPEETDRLLPFFIGLQLIHRLQDMRGDLLAVDAGLTSLEHWTRQ